MSTSQFPPSSPIFGSDSEEIQTKGLLISAKASDVDAINASNANLDYPTPAPSSSTGFLSSEPNFNENKENVPPSSPLKAKLPIKRSFSVRNPIPVINKRAEPLRGLSKDTLPSIIPRESLEHQVARVSKVLRINTAKDSSVTVGRSSKKCQFGLNPHNKLISRVHCTVSFNKTKRTVTLKCMGWNGLNVTIPSRVNVLKRGISDHLYEVVMKTESAASSDQKQEKVLEKDRRVLFEDPSFTNFYILKGESVEMPITKNVVIDIRGEILLLVFKEENSAKAIEKHTQSFSKPISPPTIPLEKNSEEKKDVEKAAKTNIQPTEVRNAKSTDMKHAKPMDVNKLKPVKAKQAELSAEAENVRKTDVKKIIKSVIKPIVKPHTKPVVAAKTINKPVAKPAIKHTFKLAVEPLARPVTEQPEATTDLAVKQEKIAKCSASDHHKRVRKAYIREEEEEEKYEFEHMSKEQIHKVLNQIPELEEVSHIVANHIAYSRLLQVPISQLLHLNPVKERGINRLQLRCILVHHLDFIGIIHRHGTDAAGLPLDEEYYYIPEKDEDKSRVTLVEELKGSASHLRSCRKTHKQYFWKKPKK